MAYKRVFQMGFDIAEGEDVNPEEVGSLFNAIENLINNFYDINGNRVAFQSVGCENSEDMSHAYDSIMIAELNEE